MANKILADTSVLIDLQRGKEKTIKLFDKYKDQITISRITACEFIYGAKNKTEKEINKNFMSKVSIVEINEPISSYTYSLLDKYGLRARFGIADALIASTAVVKELQLWTFNTKHFKKIKELELFNPK